MNNSKKFSVIWSEYMKYRVQLRKFDLSKIEDIIKYSEEKYFDVATHRMIVINKHDDRLVMIPFEAKEDEIMPITVHATTRQQINFRLKTGRFRYE
ncbi:hypothetical protein ACFL7M_07005 [Thermodesulfobacteriota bacterium]